jgi:hypothetical protein
MKQISEKLISYQPASIAGMLLCVLAMTGCATTSDSGPAKDAPATPVAEAIPAKQGTVSEEVRVEKLPEGKGSDQAKTDTDFGIKVESVRLSAADVIVEFRYRVQDPIKAARIINRKVHPFLLDQATGARFDVPRAPKVGTLRHMGSKLMAGRTYNILFANPGRYVKRGNKVTVTIGDLRLENLVVE